METMEAIARRKSTRDFDPTKPVPDELVTRVLEAGCQAPIGGVPGFPASVRMYEQGID